VDGIYISPYENNLVDMWKDGACLKIVQQDANVSKCGDLIQHDI